MSFSSFSALTLLVGDRKDIRSVKSHTSNAQMFYFWRPSWDQAKPGVISGNRLSLFRSVLTAIFQVNLGQPVILELMIMEVMVTTGAISRTKLQSNRHHQQTNTQLFTGRMSFQSPNQQCQSTEGNLAVKQTKCNISRPGQMSFLTLSEQCPDCQSTRQ